MFDIGFSELLLVLVIGLLVLGPERLPKAARTLGYWMGRARSTFNNLRNELEREALNQDMRQQLEKEMREMGLDKDGLSKPENSGTESVPSEKPELEKPEPENRPEKHHDA